MRKTLVAVLAAVLGLMMAMPAAASPARSKAPTIASIAVGGGFDTLVAAVSCTGLISAIDDPTDTQLTVFAPTDEAFAALGLDASNVCSVPGLASILTYHIVPGRLPAARVVRSTSLATLNGASISVSGATLNGSTNIVATNLQASNGVVHVIDAVLLP
jgi:uncharacterized surface protein with fasciclin (FAS1) repeats